MKIIFTADPHLAAYSNDPVVKGIPEKLYYTMIVLNKILEYAKNESINTIVIAGDLIHTKSIIHSVAQSIFLDFVRGNKDFNFIVLDGNHDQSSRSGKGVSALKFLDSESNVITIHETTLMEDLNLYMVPWNPENMIDDIKKGPKDSYLVSHLGVTEAKLNSGISIVSDIGLKDFKKYKHALLGHYHKPQNIKNVTYIGSPIQMDWGEKNDEKRFIVLDTETGEMESILTEGYKKYIEIELTEANKDEIIEQSREFIKEGHFIKLNKIEEFDTSSIEEEFRVVSKVEKDITNRGIDSSMTMEEKFSKYLEIKQVPANYKDVFIHVGIDIVNECERKAK